ncbi:MAG: hypothetical protein M3R38_34860 [Actinomycetota bacterium]|nr:hypothetical protein [Actinomycetota bacterium]
MSEERQDPETFAYALTEHLVDEHGDDAEEYLFRVLAEVFELEPGILQRFTSSVLEDFTEEAAALGHDVVGVVEAVEEKWGQDA